MGIIDAFLINGENISKGLKEIQGKKDYLIVKKDNDIVCFFYDLDAGVALINKYLEDQGINDTKTEKKTLKNKSEELVRILPKKLVIYDGKITTYETVIEAATRYNIKGYNPNKLKHTINKFETINPK